MSVENHLRNIDREYEVIKNVLYQMCTALMIETRSEKRRELWRNLRDELDDIYPSSRIQK